MTTETRTPGFVPVPHASVTIDDCFWRPRQEINRTVTLPAQYEHCRETGRLEALRLNWTPGDPEPHKFWDSDLAKWLEAASYVLARHPDDPLREAVEETVRLFEQAQQPDGYLNSHFQNVEPGNRWTNLRDHHELYCAGHLMEAAVAHAQATGERHFLDAVCRYADHIAARFGPGPEQVPGVPGHEEIELALVRLYRATGRRAYLQQARFFVDQRGRTPKYFRKEAEARGEAPDHTRRHLSYWQAHKPVREQEKAVGHAVRAAYLYTGMADVAAETGDTSLVTACERLFRNVTRRRMYVTGGIGSTREGERFTEDYDLPNETAYAETCAAIALVFWMHRMLQRECDAKYADTLERALYNGALSGISLDGKRYFYVNPLAVHRGTDSGNGNRRFAGVRQEWFGCACCPPNIARLLASVGGYVASVRASELAVHLYIGGRIETRLAGEAVALDVETNYPWEGTVAVTVHSAARMRFGLRLRIPGWCPEATVEINGVRREPEMIRGYARLEEEWSDGDRITVRLVMPVQRVYAHARVRADRDRVALQRGPLVYCFEGVDNGGDPDALALPRGRELLPKWEPDLLGGVVTLRTRGVRLQAAGDALYGTEPPGTGPGDLVAVPYYAWENRDRGDMLVWIREV